jgi:GNAT superfamily N-acetyltransferase
VNVRPLHGSPGELDAVAALLHGAFARAAEARGAAPAWSSAADARALVERYLADERNGHAAVAEIDGAVLGVGFVRRRGEVATLGPIAAAAPGRGTGSQVLDELVAQAEAWGCGAIRLFQDAWNPDSFALYAGRSFAAVDVIACVARPAGRPPRIDALRGLEVSPFKPADVAELAALDLRLTGLDRRDDLGALVRLVARRRGAVCGFLGVAGRSLGPALALDVADLFALVGRALSDMPDGATARLSTAAPTGVLAALGLGFRVDSLGTLMVRGVTPPARPPQLFSLEPEIL